MAGHDPSMNAIHPDMEDSASTKTMQVVVSAAEPARRCEVGRATIHRAIEANRFPYAVKSENGWEIPLEDLKAAGFDPDASEKGGELGVDEVYQVIDALDLPGPARQLLELELQLVRARADAEIERARYEAAAQLAEARLSVIEAQCAAIEIALRHPSAFQAAQSRPAATRPMQTRFRAFRNRACKRRTTDARRSRDTA